MLKEKVLTLPESNLIVFCNITEDVNHPGIFLCASIKALH